MLRSRRLFAARVLVMVVCLGALPVLAGPLSPPAGPVTPTDKPLADIEPRVVIHQADIPLDIDKPGSYVLGESVIPLAGSPIAITINADNVSLDLGGFAIMQNDGAMLSFSRGVQVAGTAQNVTIRNGVVRGSINNGVDCLAGSRVRVESIHASNNGGDGISVADFSAVIGCTASDNFVNGVDAGEGCVVQSCVASENTGRGINTGPGATVSDCVAQGNGDRGVNVGSDSVVERCAARGNANYGIVSGSGCTLNQSTASNTSGAPGDGFFVGASSTVTGCSSRSNNVGFDTAAAGGVTFSDCNASSNGSSGFSLDNGSSARSCVARSNGFEGFSVGNGCTLETCTASLNDEAGFATGAGCVLVGCVADGNGRADATRDGFDLGASNRLRDCVASDNADDGYDINAPSATLDGCVAHSNNGTGFSILEGGLGATLDGCTGSENGADGFLISGRRCRIVSCVARQNGFAGFAMPQLVPDNSYNYFGKNHVVDDGYDVFPPVLNFRGTFPGPTIGNGFSADPHANTGF